MKKILSIILMMLPIMATAQNTWEISENENGKKQDIDSKYLVGAVPVTDGKVVFETTLKAPGLSAKQIYTKLLNYMTAMTKEKNQIEQSRISIKDSVKHEICGNYQEWLVFKSTALVLDRTRFFYNLIVECKDGSANVKMTRIYYLYDEERNPETYKAEEWITDEFGLKKNKDKLSRVSGKFRKKTIDRKDYIFNKMASLLK
ncbi:MAG: DUF4468 domain-containing protein [Prevotella sp.]